MTRLTAPKHQAPGVEVLRADVSPQRSLVLTGEMRPNGKALFTATIVEGLRTSLYETGSYGAAQRCYKRLLAGKRPR